MAAVFLIAVLVLALLDPVTSSTGSHWSYEGHTGPSYWKNSYHVCGGHAQSPINIDSRYVSRGSNRAFISRNYDTHDVEMKLLNNGHTVEVEVLGHNKLTISGGGLPSTYTLAQFHFHWGSQNNKGSEHTINRYAAPMEMHLVHYRSSYSSLKSAMDKKDGLAVLSFLFYAGSHSSDVIRNHLIPYFNRVHYSGSEVEITPFALEDLLPRGWENGQYFRYQGSLTTPPCYESVIWSVFNKQIAVSSDQLQRFRSLQSVSAGYDDDDDFPIVNNFRPVQYLNGRRITV
ncbi:hypothetical protein ACOMHN_038582 [Nucella lapillus]